MKFVKNWLMRDWLEKLLLKAEKPFRRQEHTDKTTDLYTDQPTS